MTQPRQLPEIDSLQVLAGGQMYERLPQSRSCMLSVNFQMPRSSPDFAQGDACTFAHVQDDPSSEE